MPTCRRRNVARFRYLSAFNISFEPDVEPESSRFQIWFRASLVTAVLTLFDASLLFTLRRSYLKYHVQDSSFVAFRVDSDRKWRSSSAIFRANNAEMNTFFLISLYIVNDHSRYPTKVSHWVFIIHSDCRKRQNVRTRCWLCFPSRVCGVASKRFQVGR